MNNRTTKATLNRAVFSQTALSSASLTVLATLFHRFTMVGDFELFVQRGERTIHRGHVQIVETNAPKQLNVDLTKLGESNRDDCCPDEGNYTLALGGVMGFYASQGIGQYSVRVQHLGRERKEIVFDSSRMVPEGDLFAVTLVRPGIYRVSDAEGAERGEIKVSLPRRGNERFRVDQGELVQYSEKEAKPRNIRIYVGQSVAFHFITPATIRVELIKPDDQPGEKGERERYRYQRRAPKAGDAGKPKN